MPASRRRIARAVAIGFAAVGVACCFVGPSPEKIACLQRCARQKDSCLLAASNATSIAVCDERSQACGDGCRS
jgi:hypothetical protein